MVASCEHGCEHGYESSGLMKVGELLAQLTISDSASEVFYSMKLVT